MSKNDLELIGSKFDYIVISVGSEKGTEEYKINKSLDKDVVTIDPKKFKKDSKKQSSGTFILPMYSTMDHYIDEKGKPKKTALVLDWPSPQSLDKNVIPYDVESIVKLDPELIIIRYESSGISSSNQLHGFLSSCDCPHWSMISSKSNKCDGKYKKVFLDELMVKTEYVYIV
jgi:hypothetical protein